MCNGTPRATSIITSPLTEAPHKFTKLFAYRDDVTATITTPDPYNKIVVLENPTVLPKPSPQGALAIIS